MDRSSSPGGKHNKGIKPRVVYGKEIDNDLYSLSFGPITPPPPFRHHDKPSNEVTSSTGQHPVVTSSTTLADNCSSGYISNPININTFPADLQDHQQQLVHPELNIIPEEKDTQQQNQLHNSKLGKVRVTCNGEIDIAHQTHRLPTSPLNSSDAAEEKSGATESLTSCSILRNLQLHNNNNSHSATLGKPATGDASSDPGSEDRNCTSNHLNHIQTSNNDSNNSSINNNSYNNSLTNGVIRNNNSNNSSNHFLQYNNKNNSASSFTSTTMPPTAPNGIPTIIIPPAQQTKQSVNNAKLDMINNGRYRSVIHRHSLTYRGAVLNLKRYRLRPASSCPDIISVATSADGRGCGSFFMNLIGDVGRWIQDVCEWENLVNTRFFLFILSNLLLYTWYDVPYMYLQSAAVRHGYSEDLSSYLISSIGLSNVVGNILLGYMGDKKWASATIVYGVCMIICGITTVLMPYLMEWSYWSLFTVCGVFGLTIAANYALTSVILVQVVSLERFASAYGLLLLVQGIGNLVGPPIAGVISDMTGTNTWSFLVAGVGIFISSFFVLAPIFQREMEPVSGNQPVETHNNSV